MLSDDFIEITDTTHTLISDIVENKSKIEELVHSYIETSPAVKLDIDFKEGSEWFNVNHALSISNNLQNKLVVLDFFTYCCINCLHILPHLKNLEKEFSVKDGVVVIGVHSAKFDNEKDSSNILAAIQRYDISHPVVNDPDGFLWNHLGVQCWPTIVVLSPLGNVLFILVGEKLVAHLTSLMQAAVSYYQRNEQLSQKNIEFIGSGYLAPVRDEVLRFPGKVSCIACDLSNNCVEAVNDNLTSVDEKIAISDSGNHRIIVLKKSGKIEHIIGGKNTGFTDGSFSEARFSSPQGVVFHNPYILYVADMGNNAIRKVNLQTCKVMTVVGSSNENTLPEACKNDGVNLSSPWDVCIVPFGQEKQDVLLIAMAGVHQIWALFLATTSWWKGKVYHTGDCIPIAGTGREENRNNSYPHSAAFAQPSGICFSSQLQAIFISDSESSTIRKLSLSDGKVSAVVGGERDPFNLFGFGDIDGIQYNAKLQHPLGVTWSTQEHCLYIVDSYNHKIKKIDVDKNFCQTFIGSGMPGNICSDTSEIIEFNEPGGLCVSADERELYVADTNNHSIKIINIEEKSVRKLNITVPSYNELELSNPTDDSVTISSRGGNILIKLEVLLDNKLTLTSEAPQRWSLKLPGPNWTADKTSGDYKSNIDIQLTSPPSQADSENVMLITFMLYVCLSNSLCKLKKFTISLKILHHIDGPNECSYIRRHIVSD